MLHFVFSFLIDSLVWFDSRLGTTWKVKYIYSYLPCFSALWFCSLQLVLRSWFFFFFIQMSLPLPVFHKIFTVPRQGPSFYPVSKESFLLFLSCAVNLSFYRITAYLRCTSNWMLFQFLRVLLSRFPNMLS